MKKVPKYVYKLIERRYRLAMELLSVSADLDEYISKIGSLDDPEIADSVCTGCLIYCEPEVAKRAVKEYIEKNLDDKGDRK